ncbi:transposase [Nitrospira lenta]|uniref:TnpA9 n=1 Tax=Nitrospira lenta TaxID=1436998 RepID=A0A330L823_9BACT
MNRSKFSEEQIIDYDIRPAKSSTPIDDLCRQLGIGEVTFYTEK